MSAQEKLRVVYDCNVLLVAAAKENSTAAACLWLARSGYVRLFISQDVLEEVTAIPSIKGNRTTGFTAANCTVAKHHSSRTAS